MKQIILFFLAALSSIALEAQNRSQDTLPYITDYPIKIDGGCSFFADASKPLYTAYPPLMNKHQLIIAPPAFAGIPNQAFIQYKPHFYYIFRFQKRIKNRKGYIDYYKGNKGSFTLAVDSVKWINDYQSLRYGTLKMTAIGLNATVKVHGLSDELKDYTGYITK